MINFEKVLHDGTFISSSGTTGSPKKIFREPRNLRRCNEVAVQSQKLSPKSRVLTVTRMSHAGGLLAQSLPAFSIGADVVVKQFNAFSFLKDFLDFTHTFLTPDQMATLLKTKGFAGYDFSGKRILTGSEPVDLEVIRKFVKRGALVQPNWGMSEVGPLTIHSVIDSEEQIDNLQKILPQNAFLLGDQFEVDYKVVEGELVIRGPICIHKDWFHTGDLVVEREGVLFGRGRKQQS